MARKAQQPDPVLVKDQLQALQTILKAHGAEHFCRLMFWILPKKQHVFSSKEKSAIVPFRFNRSQRHRHDNIAQHNIEVKPRQIGSTVYYALVRLLMPTITDAGIGSLLVAQNARYATSIFKVIRRAYKMIGAVDPYDSSQNDLNLSLKQHLLHTVAANKRELFFDQLDSHILVESAEVEEAAQSITLHHVLADEYSRWPGDPEATLSNIRGALVPDGTLDRACTANGWGGPFHEAVLRALNDPKTADAKLHYYSWWWDESYELAITEKQKDAMEDDITAEELRIVKLIHKELKCVAY